MTLKEMFAKVDTYNEVAAIVNGQKMEIAITFGLYENESFKDYKSWKKYAKENYAEDLMNAIISCKDFEFGKTYGMTYRCYGIETKAQFEFNLYRA